MKMTRTALSVAAMIALVTACMLAHADPGSIEVHVWASSPVTVVLMSGSQVKAVSLVPVGTRGCLLQNLQPGNYALVASASRYNSVTRAVTVPDGGEAEVWLELTKLTDNDYKTRGRVVGFVKDANGDPVANVTLTLMKVNKPVGAARPVNATGVYELEWYPPGTYTVIAVAPGFKTGTYAGQRLAAGTSTRLDVVLQPK